MLGAYTFWDAMWTMIVFFAWVMFITWVIMLLIAWGGSYLIHKERIEQSRPLLWAIFLSFPLPFIATLTGWFTAEVGRQPWTVYGVLRTADAVTPTPYDGQPPIGRPIANTRVYVLDGALQPVPVGVAGELYIAGAGVVRGYLHRPDLTAERFVRDPFSVDPAARMYRTGDLVRHLPDGAIEFLGRMDFQVKIRGYRIELGEIETLLERAPGVRQAVVVVRENKPGDKRLVAYLVPDSAATDLSRLRSDLRESLPEYMQPAAYVMLEAMPLTANGKIDRKALPAPKSLEPLPEVAYHAPETSLQRQIADLWKETLGVEYVSIHDNFFDLGAHSLLVAEVHGKLSELLGREIPLVTMFRYPTIRSLASHLRQPSTEGSALKASADRALARRKFVQRRMTSG